MTATEAADYLGMTVTQFRSAVMRGELPRPFIHGRPNRWSKVQIDWALEGRAEKGASSGDHDPVMERLSAIYDEVRL
jgi:hypothetical protein